MLYISTTSIINNKDLFNVLDRYNKLGIKNIELGSVHNFIKDFSLLFKFQKENDTNFIIHGFFPPTKEKFFINLSSQNKKILKKSIEFCKKSIEMCRKLNSNIYTTHPGFSKEIIYNNKMKYNLEVISKEHDKDLIINTLKESVIEVCDYAKNYDIKIAIETMGIGDNATIMNTPNIFIDFFKNIKLKNLRLLFDTGHMKVNSFLSKTTKMVFEHAQNFPMENSDMLKFDFKESVEKLKKYTIALHLQDNKGKGEDEHLPIKNTIILDCFGKEFLKDKYLTLEGQNNWKEKDILESKQIVENYLS